jgi:hypothetical protein
MARGSKQLNINFGWGTWDSWGFGLNYCRYAKSVTIEFIHWYFYVEMWSPRDN